jgi:hypothetical protein
MNRQTHTIRQAAGGCSHFARVTVSLGNEPSVSSSNDVPPDWIEAAQAGVQRALDEIGSVAQVVVVDVQGTYADSRTDTMFVAGAIAAFRLLGSTDYVERFENSKWEIASSER